VGRGFLRGRREVKYFFFLPNSGKGNEKTYDLEEGGKKARDMSLHFLPVLKGREGKCSLVVREGGGTASS